MGASHPRWTAATLVVSAIAAVALSACASEQSAALPPARVGAATDDPARAEAAEAALAAYAGYLAAAEEAEHEADPQHPDLKKYLADPLLTRVRLAIRDTKEHGAMRTGSLISDPTVTEVNLDSVPATVVIQDCLDATNYQLVYVDDRDKVVPGTEVGRYLATATATRYDDGRWLISAGSSHPDQPC
ncbi:hypothetical protein O7632_03595 [Solwaraspora sp. WMMD406]|uniref:hypothetical protein n=1 Tax=Solwaraspora sp. WMMD406 TaxID=3016095 RepID=UPI0024168692|nr:hypothetical protein [Solwaraspora sp. WMMD406]MDG4763196.1 hypothetical protein [Solwaraspora sp. WMMD406]